MQTIVGNGASALGAYAGGLAAAIPTLGIGIPVGAFTGAVAASTAYSAFVNKQIGELARPVAEYIVSRYSDLEENK